MTFGSQFFAQDTDSSMEGKMGIHSEKLYEKKKKAKDSPPKLTGGMASVFKGNIKAKTNDDYKTQNQVKRAIVAGLFKKIGKLGNPNESVASDMIDLVVEGYDAMDIIEKMPDFFKKNKKKKDDAEDDDDMDEDVVEMSPSELRKHLASKKKKGKLPSRSY